MSLTIHFPTARGGDATILDFQFLPANGATAAFIGPDPKPSWTGAVHGSTFHVDVPLDRVAAAVAGAAKLGIVVSTRFGWVSAICERSSMISSGLAPTAGGWLISRSRVSYSARSSSAMKAGSSETSGGEEGVGAGMAAASIAARG